MERRAELEALEGKYPVDLAGIRVHNFGKVKVETSGSPEFPNPVQIYQRLQSRNRICLYSQPRADVSGILRGDH